jgi:hypothetical protein
MLDAAQEPGLALRLTGRNEDTDSNIFCPKSFDRFDESMTRPGA